MTLTIPKCDKGIRHLCHFCISYWPSSFAVTFPVGWMQLTFKIVVCCKFLSERICTRSMTGHNYNVVSLHLVLKIKLTTLFESNVIVEVSTASYNNSVFFHLTHTGTVPLCVVPLCVEDKELDKEVVVRKFRTTTQHGSIDKYDTGCPDLTWDFWGGPGGFPYARIGEIPLRFRNNPFDGVPKLHIFAA